MNDHNTVVAVTTDISQATFDAITAVIQHQMEHAIEGLKADLSSQTATYPKAAEQLEILMSTWITGAEQELATFRTHRIAPLIDVEAEIERAKRRYRAELHLIKMAYPSEDVEVKYVALCASLDGPYRDHFLVPAAQQRWEYRRCVSDGAFCDS